MPGLQVVECPANHIRPLSLLRNKFEVFADDARKARKQLAKQLARAQVTDWHRQPRSRPAHFCTNMWSVLSISRPLSRNPIFMIRAGLISGQFGSPNRPTGAGNQL